MITLYAVRHGETDYNRENRVQGTLDSVLTEFGMEQARAVGRAFAKIEYTSIYASPLQRAYNTAACITSETKKTEIVKVDDFRELNCGTFEGMLLEEIQETRWREWQRFLGNPEVAPENGESMNQLAFRVEKALNGILSAAGPDDTIVIVSHAGVVRMIMASLMDVSVKSAVNFGLSNASIARFINKYERWTCLSWNSTEHLDNLKGKVKFVL